MHERAAILSTGDELLIGQLLDTNSRFFAEALTDLGIVPVEHVTVGDDLPTLVSTLRRLCRAAPLVIVSGGLGPTDGDLTRAALAQLTGEPLIEDAGARAALEARFHARGRSVSERQLRQATRPASATCLPNAHGTAPGLHVPVLNDMADAPHRTTDVFCLPGPPGELKPMWKAVVVPRLSPDPARAVVTRLLHVIGLAEADAVDRLGPLTTRTNMPLVGITASGAVLTVRIRYEGPAHLNLSGGGGGESGKGASRPATPTEAVERAAKEVRARLAGFIFAEGEATLESAVLEALRAKRCTLALAESCTGGLLGASLTAIPGASVSLLGGWVTYSNALKQSQLEVPADLLAQHGAVSVPVARAMALGALEHSGADHALSITGIAGPDGGSAAKPVGTVFISHAWRDASRTIADDTRHFVFSGTRDDVRVRAARSALAMLWFRLNSSGEPPRLLWQNA